MTRKHVRAPRPRAPRRPIIARLARIGHLVLGAGAPARRPRLLAIAVAPAILVSTLPWASAAAATGRRHATRRRPPRPHTRPLARGAHLDPRRLSARVIHRSRWLLGSVHVAVPHGRSRRRVRLLVPRTAIGHRRPHHQQPPRPARRPIGMRAIITSAAQRHHVAPSWLLGVAVCESGLNPRAYNPSSGASGLFQFMPTTFYSHGGRDLWNPFQQADVAAAMFAAGEASAWVCT